MTDDLVKHLRSGDVSIKMPDGSIQYVNHVAADRIEQLEAALREIVAMTPDPEFGTLPIEVAIKVARAVLGEEGGKYDGWR